MMSKVFIYGVVFIVFCLLGLSFFFYSNKTSQKKIVLKNHNVFVLFDFDGTIADSFTPAMLVLNELSDEFGYKKIPQEQWAALKDYSAMEILKKINISWYKLPSFVYRAKKCLACKIATMMPIVGVKELLLNMKANGYQFGIVTSNSQENVKAFLEQNGIDVFEVIYADSSVFGKDKVLKRFLKNTGLMAHNVVYVGDEVRDIAAAHKVGIRMIAVTWGFNSRSLLTTYKPEDIIDQPDQFVLLLEKYGTY
jgi:phosphoglycolate phosphatase